MSSRANMRIPKLIALIGATGTGKTTFANDASGGDLEVGDHLESCTQIVNCSPVFQVDGQEVALFDTPGFDDSELSDTEVLKRITAFLTSTYKGGHKLTGIIYLHRIGDNRMSGMSRRTFKILRELCGKETLSNVLIVTNMWSDPPSPRELQNEKQLEESPKFFQPAIQAGARMVRRPHKDTRSAHDIIRLLLDKPPVTMKIQRQIVDNGEGFYTTDAARVLGEELAEAEQRHLQEIAEVREELRKAKEENDLQTQNELREYLEQAVAESARLAKEIQSLRQGFEEERLRWEMRVDAAEEARRESERRQREMSEHLEELRRQAEQASDNERSRIEALIAELTSRLAEVKSSSWGCVVM